MSTTIQLPRPTRNESPIDEPRYEVVNGDVVELSPKSAFETIFITALLIKFGAFVKSRELGRTACETLFTLNESAGLRRRPDAAFVSYDRWPKNQRVPRTESWDIVPDLAIEVVSRSNTVEEVLGKIREYFAAGCRLVWVVYPTEEQIYVFRSPTQTTIFARNDTLDGGDVLPGFQLPLAELFPADVHD